MEITAAQVKELRERTQAGLMDCKKFLKEAEGDIDVAIDLMKKSGSLKAAKKEGRIAAEGLIGIAASDDGKQAALVEINCETDFVARSDDFQNFVKAVANQVLQTKAQDVAAFKDAELADGKTVEQAREDLVAKIGENINVRRICHKQTDNGLIASYVHGNRIGVLVTLEGGDEQLGKDMAMQIAASNPEVILPEDVPQALLDKEKEIFIAQAQESGKPPEIIEKMISGRINKFLQEVSLVGHDYVKDPNTKVGKVLEQAKATVVNFERFEVGEGIEKKQDNFVEEVMAQTRGE